LRRDLARRLCVVWLRQALLGDPFPVEPLPANILVLPDRSIAFTDGLLASVPSKAKANLWEYLMAAAAENPDRASFCLLKELTKGARRGYEDDLRLRFRQVVPFRDGEWSCGGEEDFLADYLFLHWRLAGERGYVPQYYLPGFYRGLFALVGTAQRLSPGRDTLIEALRDVRLLAGIERFWEMLTPDNLGEQAEKYAATMSEMPQTLDEVLTLASEGRARLGLQVPESAERHGRQNSFAVTLSALLVFVGFALLAQHLPARFAGAWTGGLGTVVFVALGGALLWAASRS
jgi:ubiquinone biosynthesis protein